MVLRGPRALAASLPAVWFARSLACHRPARPRPAGAERRRCRRSGGGQHRRSAGARARPAESQSWGVVQKRDLDAVAQESVGPNSRADRAAAGTFRGLVGDRTANSRAPLTDAPNCQTGVGGALAPLTDAPDCQTVWLPRRKGHPDANRSTWTSSGRGKGEGKL